MSSGLRRFEAWMQREVSRPFAPDRLAPRRRRAIERVVEPSSSLDAAGRLAIYAESIRSRLVECLEHDFPATRRALGPERFARVAGGFVERRPPRHFSLARLGDRFPAFVAALPRSVPRRALAADLAAIERAIQEVFDAPREPELAGDELAAAATRHGANLRLRPIAALRLVETRHAADRYVEAVLRGRARVPPAVRRRSTTLVWRRDLVVRRRDLDPAEAEVLGCLLRGARVGAALARTSASGREVERWFASWASAGLFAAAGPD